MVGTSAFATPMRTQLAWQRAGLRSASASSPSALSLSACEDGRGRVGGDASHGPRVASRLAVLAACALCLVFGDGGGASATTGMGMDIDLRGARPSDLGPTAGRQFLALCNVDRCISSSEEVGSGPYVEPWLCLCVEFFGGEEEEGGPRERGPLPSTERCLYADLACTLQDI
jgi:hypothetical protein